MKGRALTFFRYFWRRHADDTRFEREKTFDRPSARCRSACGDGEYFAHRLRRRADAPSADPRTVPSRRTLSSGRIRRIVRVRIIVLIPAIAPVLRTSPGPRTVLVPITVRHRLPDLPDRIIGSGEAIRSVFSGLR